MKFKIHFKTPGAGDDALNVIEATAKTREEYSKAEQLVEKWISHGEVITVEIDTENESIRVVER